MDSEMIKQYLPPGFLKEIYKIAEDRAKNGKDWKSKEDGEEKGIIVDKDGHIVDGPFPLAIHKGAESVAGTNEGNPTNKQCAASSVAARADAGPCTEDELEGAAFKLVGEAAELDSGVIKQYLSPELLKEIYKIAEERAKNGVDWENEEDGEGKMIIIDKDGHIVDGPFPLTIYEGCTDLESVEASSEGNPTQEHCSQGDVEPLTEDELETALAFLLADGCYFCTSHFHQRQLIQRLQHYGYDQIQMELSASH
ncbi:hypothetical protein PGT21_030206 [Puccinia graminis f. sp. tritici]|nr:hypothetical protein PGT21_030206 [Puccinia graminis f. sp. tritici]